MQSQNKKEWWILWTRLEAKGDPIKVYNDLVLRYSERHRSYHTMRHIRLCLDELKEVRHLINSPLAVELAIWLHDSIYNTHSKGSEEESAILAVKMVREAFLPYPLGDTIYNLIMTTKQDYRPPNLEDSYLRDIDLTILGQSEKMFDWYEKGIRIEYSWVSEEVFSKNRIALLESLTTSFVYSTTYFREKYEVQARINIARSVMNLKQIRG